MAERRPSVRTVCLVAPDLNGRLRSRQVPVEVFDPQDTACFADIVLAFDRHDALIPRPAGFTGWWPGWDDGFGDLVTTPDLASRRRLGWRDDEDVVFADLSHGDGRSVRVAPRQVLHRVVGLLASTGMSAVVGTEVEFFLSEEAAPRTPVHRDAYAFSPPSADRRVLEDVTTALAASGIGVLSWYAEGGPRQYELALAPTDPVTAADTTLLARHAVGETARRHGLRASFHPKPGPGFGSGLHVHVSLHTAGVNLLRGVDGDRAHPVGRHALAGLVAVLGPATAVLTPTPEGYGRLVPHSAAGTSATWAHDNRGAGVRFLDRGDQARLEVRTAASDAHPHLVVATILAGLVSGIRAAVDPAPAVVGNVYVGHDDLSLPGGLGAAADALRGSEDLRDQLGAEFVDFYAATRDWAASTPPDDLVACRS